MSIKKSGGLWYITPDVFTNTELEHGKKYTVILLADGEVVVNGTVIANIGDFESDWRLHLSNDDLASLSLRMPFYSTRDINGFDIIIRDDAKTLIMLPNVSYSRA